MLYFLNKILARFGYVLSKDELIMPRDLAEDKEFMELYEFCRPYTMTSPERMFGLYQSVRYIIENNIEGDFVECGVWKGGSSMLIARLLTKLNIFNRNIYLYDTFEGMTQPSDIDKDFAGVEAKVLLEEAKIEDSNSVWCYSALEEVQNNLFSTGYQRDRIRFVKGKVEETIPGIMPGLVAILRLDTDWYESTSHELKYLYPLIQNKGILILDDFGHWEGAKNATLEYFRKENDFPLINRLDYTGRLIIKI